MHGRHLPIGESLSDGLGDTDADTDPFRDLDPLGVNRIPVGYPDGDADWHGDDRAGDDLYAEYVDACVRERDAAIRAAAERRTLSYGAVLRRLRRESVLRGGRPRPRRPSWARARAAVAGRRAGRAYAASLVGGAS